MYHHAGAVGCIPARVPSRQVKSSANFDELCAYFQISNHSCALNLRIFASSVETVTMLARPVPRQMFRAVKSCWRSQSGAYRHAFLLRVVASRRRLEGLAGNLRLSCALIFDFLIRVVRLVLNFSCCASTSTTTERADAWKQGAGSYPTGYSSGVLTRSTSTVIAHRNKFQN